MKILISSYGLDLSGVPTATLTTYNELKKRGHDVVVYSPLGGVLGKKMNTFKEVDRLEKPDVILAQNNICAEDLHKKFPNTPLIFYSHSIWVDMEQPPSFSADKYLAINETVFKNMQYRGVNPKKITVVRDFVDINLFKPVKPINKTLKKVLFLSNYKKWNNYKAVSKACEQIGVDLKCVGSPYGKSDTVEKEINEADLVISWGRGIIEAMACGRTVVSFDKLVGDGYIDRTNYFSARRDNFCGYLSQRDFKSVNELIEEILKYSPQDGEINRKLSHKYHDSRKCIEQILELIHQI